MNTDGNSHSSNLNMPDASVEAKRQRLLQGIENIKSLYAPLRDFDVLKEVSRHLWGVLNSQFRGVNPSRPMLVSFEEDILKPVLLYCLIQLGDSRLMGFMNVYRLVGIHLGNDEEYRTVHDIHDDFLVLYSGYHETDNAIQNQVIAHVLEKKILMGDLFWYFHRGNIVTSKYGPVYNYLKLRGVPHVHIPATSPAAIVPEVQAVRKPCPAPLKTFDLPPQGHRPSTPPAPGPPTGRRSVPDIAPDIY